MDHKSPCDAITSCPETDERTINITFFFVKNNNFKTIYILKTTHRSDSKYYNLIYSIQIESIKSIINLPDYTTRWCYTQHKIIQKE